MVRALLRLGASLAAPLAALALAPAPARASERVPMDFTPPVERDLSAWHAALAADGVVSVAIVAGYESNLRQARHRDALREELVRSLVRDGGAIRREGAPAGTDELVAEGVAWRVGAWEREPGARSPRDATQRLELVETRAGTRPLTFRIRILRTRHDFVAALGEDVAIYSGHSRHGRGPAFAHPTDYFRMASYEVAPVLEVRAAAFAGEDLLQALPLDPRGFVFRDYARRYFEAARRGGTRPVVFPLRDEGGVGWLYKGPAFVSERVRPGERMKLVRGGAADLHRARRDGAFGRDPAGGDRHQLVWLYSCNSALHFRAQLRASADLVEHADGWREDVPRMFPDAETSPALFLGTNREVLTHGRVFGRLVSELVRRVPSTGALLEALNAYAADVQPPGEARRPSCVSPTPCFTAF